MNKLDKKGKRRGKIDSQILVDDCEQLIDEMKAATLSDMANNKAGRPGI